MRRRRWDDVGALHLETLASQAQILWRARSYRPVVVPLLSQASRVAPVAPHRLARAHMHSGHMVVPRRGIRRAVQQRRSLHTALPVRRVPAIRGGAPAAAVPREVRVYSAARELE